MQGVSKGSPRWGQRTQSAIFDYKTPAMIYMYADTMTPQELSEDWRASLFVKVTEQLQ